LGSREYSSVTYINFATILNAYSNHAKNGG
jgi:hypothetical protein